jgi:hypothetical protein
MAKLDKAAAGTVGWVDLQTPELARAERLARRSADGLPGELGLFPRELWVPSRCGEASNTHEMRELGVPGATRETRRGNASSGR